MNVAPGGFVTPGPHGPQVIPGVYTLKLIVDGWTYTQSVTVRNDPRVGQSPKVMADLRAKNKLILLAYQGAMYSYGGNSEVLAVRQQVASLNGNQLSEDVAKATKDINVKLATFGGVVAACGGRGAGGGSGGRSRGDTLPPGAIKPFNTLNASFNAIVSTSQVGLDEAPTQAQIDAWEAGCTRLQRHGDGMEKNAVGGSRCLQCASKQKPSESSTGVSEHAERSAVQIHSAGRAGKGVSKEIVEAFNSCRRFLSLAAPRGAFSSGANGRQYAFSLPNKGDERRQGGKSSRSGRS